MNNKSVQSSTSGSFIFTSESVTEGHPDKVCDTVADAILDAYLVQDPLTRINIEVLAKADNLVLAGEISSRAEVDAESVARTVLRKIGYADANEKFDADTVKVHKFTTEQAAEIDNGVTAKRNRFGDQGAGDQGMMFGYATRETPELMPLPITLAHKVTNALAQARRGDAKAWMRPDGKSQVSVLYENGRPVAVQDVVVSVQHVADKPWQEIHDYVVGILLPRTLGDWFSPSTCVHVNPTGSFVRGGPEVDSGLTGRKIIVDTYGGSARHGGGSFSGKDPSKVDRSGAYFARYVARKVVESGMTDRAEIQVAYVIGEAKPVSVNVNVFGQGDEEEASRFVSKFDFRPAAIIEQLNLLAPVYSLTTNYGHFGKPELAWEK
jgi:S-adenosylmethionine synthetase